MGEAPLGGTPDPVVRRSRRATRLVDGHPLEVQAAVNATLRERVGIDVAVFVCFGQGLQDARRMQAVRVESLAGQIGSVGRNAMDGTPRCSFGTKATTDGQHWRGNRLKQ